jgi:hypothetical protein
LVAAAVALTDPHFVVEVVLILLLQAKQSLKAAAEALVE